MANTIFARLISCAGQSKETSPDYAYVFRKKGDYWEIGPINEEKVLKKMVGFEYILILLKSPDKEIGVLDLDIRVNGTGFVPSDQEMAAENEFLGDNSAGSISSSLSVSGDDGTQPDSRAMQEYWQEVEKIQNNITMAEETGNTVKTEQLQEDLENLFEQIGKEKWAKKLTSKTGPHEERQRKAIGIAITRAVDTICKEIPAMETIIGNQINKRRTPSYRPDPENPINWLLK